MVESEAAASKVLAIQAATRGYLARKKVERLRKSASEFKDSTKLNSPFVPTSADAIDAFLHLAKVEKEDSVLDIGCGDGRVVLTAARKRGCTGAGFDSNGELVRRAKDVLERENAAVRTAVAFHQLDVQSEQATALITNATVVFLYLLPEMNAFLAPLLASALRKGARVVAFTFRVPTWQPIAEVPVGSGLVNLFLYSMPPLPVVVSDGAAVVRLTEHKGKTASAKPDHGPSGEADCATPTRSKTDV